MFPFPTSSTGEGEGRKVTTLTRFREEAVVLAEEESPLPPLPLLPRLNCSNRSLGRELRVAKVR